MTEAEKLLATANAVIFEQAGRYLSDVETVILTGAIADNTYEQVAETSGYSISYLRRDVGPKLWQLLSVALGEKVGKRNFRQALARYRQPPVPSPPPVPLPQPSAQAGLASWGEAPDVSFFLGRNSELTTLIQWIADDRCRLVALLGIGGIGKTALGVKLTQSLQSEFEFVVWRSLRNAPPLEMLLMQLVPLLSRQQETQPTLERLLHYLRSSRCLLVFDNLEAILHPQKMGQFLPGYDNYGHLLRLVGEVAHPSCILITSREKPGVIATQEGIELPVRSLTLSGLSDEAEGLLSAKGLSGSLADRHHLIETYGGNPLALKIAATSIQDLFNGDIATFLAQGTAVFNGVRRLLDQQFVRLSALEQTLMYWLAINRDWSTAADLQGDIIPTVSYQNLLEGLEALCRRSLIEKESGRYTQQPVVMEYVCDRLIERVVAELSAAEPNVFITHALLKTTVAEYIREAQTRLILDPIVKQFQQTFSSMVAIEQQVLRLLTALRTVEAKASGYGAGNLINFCHHLGMNLAGYDFSNLRIWHAYLQKIELHNLNFAHADLNKSLFTEAFASVVSVAFSPDGQLLASGDTQGNIYLRQTTSGQVLQTWADHQSWIRGIAFSPDGKRLASGSYDATVKLWDLVTRRCLHTFNHDEVAGRIAWSPDGTKLASVGFDQTLKIWDTQTGDCLAVLRGNGPQIAAVTWHPNGEIIACPGGDNAVLLWDARSGKQLNVLSEHTDLVWYVAFSPDGQTLVSSSQDGTLKFWSVATGSCYQTVQGNFGIAWELAFSPDGNAIAGSCQDGMVRLWETQTGTCLKILQGHTGIVWSVIFSPDGTTLASGSEDQTIKLWDTTTGHCLQTYQGYSSAIWGVAINAQQQLASAHEDSTVRLWNIDTGDCLKTLREHTSLVMSVCWQPQHQPALLLSASGDKTLGLWDTETGQCLNRLEGHLGFVHAGVWHPNGKQLASASLDGTVKIWDSMTCKCQQTLNHDFIGVDGVAWSPEGTILASGLNNCVIKLWDSSSGECLQSLAGHNQVIFATAFSPDGKLLASGAHDSTAKLWNVQTGECLHTFTGHADWVWGVAWHPDGHLLASASQDGTARLWDIQTKECHLVLEGHLGPVRAVSWHPNGEWLATGSFDETIKLWNPQTGQCFNTLRAKLPYEGMNITGVTGLTDSQKVALQNLGAIEG